jgi:predicted alpha/beta-hydrolase family hydrolase
MSMSSPASPNRSRPRIRTMTLVGFQERPLRTMLLEQDGPVGLAVIFPGAGYTCQLPLLYYSTELLLALGYDVLQVNYDYEEEFFEAAPEVKMQWLNKDAAIALEAGLQQKDYRSLVILGKSLGTRAIAGLATDRQLRQPGVKLVWLTPILTDASILPCMNQVAQPSLFVTGTADEYYSEPAVEALRKNPNARILVIEGADHSLSAAALRPHASSQEATDRIQNSQRFIEGYLNELGSFVQGNE